MSLSKDVYPSRINDKPEILERQDPVIHHGKKAVRGLLDEKKLNSYAEKGYVYLDRFFTGEQVESMSKALSDLWKSLDDFQSPAVIREAASQEIRSVFAVHESNDYFKKIARDPRLLGIAKQLLGSDVYIHQSRINFKPGYMGKGFNWHSDFETWHVEDGMPRMRAVSCSILLTDNYHFNGPLMLVPGSHKFFISCTGQTPANHFKDSLRQQELGVPDQESMKWLVDRFGIDIPTGAAGSVLFFECNTMHGSGNNISPMPRSNIFYVYNSVENKLVDPFCGQAPRPEYIASRKNSAPLQENQKETA